FFHVNRVYKIVHLLLFSFSEPLSSPFPYSFLHRLISLTNSWKASVTFTFVFAELSMNLHPISLASSSPFSFGTSLSDSKSHLLPTRTKGTLSASFTLRM